MSTEVRPKAEALAFEEITPAHARAYSRARSHRIGLRMVADEPATGAAVRVPAETWAAGLTAADLAPVRRRA